MRKAAIVACSDGQERKYEAQNIELVRFLCSVGTEVIQSEHIYAVNGVFQGSPKERADELMRMFADPEISEIYDISGGDIANQVLPYLDFSKIAQSSAVFWGYSDLTTILNAIYTMTGKESILYQVKNLVWGDEACCAVQRDRFINRAGLFDPQMTFLQGESMQGITVGGNIRCFLKLAGTKYFPDLQGKLLILEALGSGPAQIATYLAQLHQLGAFEKVNGIILGTFCKMEQENSTPDILTLLKEYVSLELPIARTAEIGHYRDAKAIAVGRYLELSAPH